MTVSFLLNGVPHAVRRSSKTNQLLLKIDDADFEEHSEEDLRRLLHIQAYSQKQLSGVSVREEELLRLIHAPLEQRLNSFKVEERDLKATLRRSYEQINSKQIFSRQIAREQLEIESLSTQVSSLRKELKGLSEDDQAIIAIHEKYLEEELIVQELDKSVKGLKEIIESAIREINDIYRSIDIDANLPNKDLVVDINNHYEELQNEVLSKLSESLQPFIEGSEHAVAYEKLISSWKKKFNENSKKYEEAKSRSIAHKSKLKQIAEIENRIRSLKESISDKTRAISKIGTPEDKYNKAWQEWSMLYSARADLVEKKCSELMGLSENAIRVILNKGAGLTQVTEQLNNIISGTRIRSKKANDLCDHIASSDNSIDMWLTVLKEFEALALIEPSEHPEFELPHTPVLGGVGFTTDDIKKIAQKITVEQWIDLSLCELTDIPTFEYQQREGDYIEFSEASAGQQATALLKVLLKMDGPPLIIDQPEEDLDNQVILEIVNDIWSAKSKRQVIFSSHNANIVVNGDADLVVVCDYRIAGDQSGGVIKNQGAIDITEIRNEITKIIEGGEAAFKLRKQKYGF